MFTVIPEFPDAIFILAKTVLDEIQRHVFCKTRINLMIINEGGYKRTETLKLKIYNYHRFPHGWIMPEFENTAVHINDMVSIWYNGGISTLYNFRQKLLCVLFFSWWKVAQFSQYINLHNSRTLLSRFRGTFSLSTGILLYGTICILSMVLIDIVDI